MLDFEIRDLRTGAFNNDFSPHVPNKNLEPNANELGIGFAMVKGILEILNGSLATMATLNDGCTYKFSIPYKKENRSKLQGIG